MNSFEVIPGEPWLLFFAHPDDEIAVAGWMRRLCRGGAEVHCCWAHSTEDREEEARIAARSIGVSQDRLAFLNFADQSLSTSMEKLGANVLSQIENARPSRVVCAAFEQGHLDHDALHVVVRSLAEDHSLFEFPEYWPYTPFVKALGEFADGDSGDVLKLDDEEVKWKAALVANYQSQALPKLLMWKRVQDTLMGVESAWMTRERLRPAKLYDFRRPVNPELIERNVHSRKQWARWIAALDSLEAKSLSTR